MTQEQVAERVDLDARHLSRLEVGRHFPTLDSLERIGDVLGVPLSEFFQFPGDESTEALRDDLTKFAEGASEHQLQLAVKAVRQIVA